MPLGLNAFEKPTSAHTFRVKVIFSSYIFRSMVYSPLTSHLDRFYLSVVLREKQTGRRENQGVQSSLSR